MARNGFRTAQYGKVRIMGKGEFYQSLSDPDATILIETHSLTVKSDLGAASWSSKDESCWDCALVIGEMSVDVILITFRTLVDDVFKKKCWDFDYPDMKRHETVVASDDAVGVRSPDAVQFFALAHSLLARVTGLFAYVRLTYGSRQDPLLQLKD
ncbi:hypothetical protein L596_001943 [Steinernema carpocapsae]|uniref:Uncharacterized protein n=1 Tax=Steinernema carpocapsae TaxID=34508 RepID=A0A4U8UNQ9_STECR|nr:hypothetical protein L596_001943 [Steinernema carpocapsae]